MKGLSEFAYVQARIQSRYGQRADEQVWLRLHNIYDLASYLQVAQQTKLHPWVLGISSTHSSHEIELALRQKYRHHIDEVARWMPDEWRKPTRWLKRLADLSTLQYLLAGGLSMEWMKSDPEISGFTVEDPTQRIQAMRDAGCVSLVDAWKQGGSLFSGWLACWNEVQPRTQAFNNCLQDIEKILRDQLLQQATAAYTMDYDVLTDKLSFIFRRYAFQPAAVFAYLAIIALDIHHIRSDLMQRLWFQSNEKVAEGLLGPVNTI